MRKDSNNEVYTKKVLPRAIEKIKSMVEPKKPKEKAPKEKDVKKAAPKKTAKVSGKAQVAAPDEKSDKKKEKVLSLTKQMKKLKTEIAVLSVERDHIDENITSMRETLQLIKEGIIDAVGSPDFIGLCVRKPLEIGTAYYYIQSLIAKEVFTVHECEWNDYFSDYLRLARENVFLDKKEADKVCMFRNHYISQFRK